jgi:hypothetical protein
MQSLTVALQHWPWHELAAFPMHRQLQAMFCLDNDPTPISSFKAQQ